MCIHIYTYLYVYTNLFILLIYIPLTGNKGIEILKKGTKIRMIKQRFLDKLHTVEGIDVDINDLYSDFISVPQLDFRGKSTCLYMHNYVYVYICMYV
jgi:hypothetical protein